MLMWRDYRKNSVCFGSVRNFEIQLQLAGWFIAALGIVALIVSLVVADKIVVEHVSVGFSFAEISALPVSVIVSACVIVLGCLMLWIGDSIKVNNEQE